MASGGVSRNEQECSWKPTWIKKIYNVDPLECPKCGGQMKVVAFIHDPREIAAIAKNRGIQPYRAPPPLRVISTKEPTVVPLWD